MTCEATKPGDPEGRELPFVVGVLADLTGSGAGEPLAGRRFVDIDGEHVDDAVAAFAPSVRLTVDDVISRDGTLLEIDLSFKRLADFEPPAIARKVGSLRKLLEIRERRQEELKAEERAVAPDAGSLLESVLDATTPGDGAAPVDWRRELQGILSRHGPPSEADLRVIDAALSAQLNPILRAPEFRRLEGTWRGVAYLARRTGAREPVKIRLLNVSRRELHADLSEAPDLDRSALYQRVRDAGFTSEAGEPLGLLVGDYEFSHHPEDVDLLYGLSFIASAFHCPFIAALSPAMFGLEHFHELSTIKGLERMFESPTYVQWRSFRDSEESRFVTLALPRVLARPPYGRESAPVEGFDLEETAGGAGRSTRTPVDSFCWMSAAYAVAARLADSFARTGLCLAARGVEGGGRVEALAVSAFPSDDGESLVESSTELAITGRLEPALGRLGFLPLCHVPEEVTPVLVSTRTTQKPKRYGPKNPAASALAENVADLRCLLFTCRFAHYLVNRWEQMAASGAGNSEVAASLNRWIARYVAPGPESPDSEYPLAEGRVDVKPVAETPGEYVATATLAPRFLRRLDVGGSLTVFLAAWRSSG